MAIVLHLVSGEKSERMSNSASTPIIGATKMSHLEQAVAATEIKLTGDEMDTLEECYQPHRILGHQ